MVYLKEFPEKIKLMMMGEIYEVENKAEAIEALKRAYDPRRDILGWALAFLVKEGLLSYNVMGKTSNDELLRAAENTLRLYNLTWDDVAKIVSRRATEY